jgi:hypothetical protein
LSDKHAHNWIDRTGEININRFGTLMKIIKYNTAQDVIIEFQDEHRIQKSIYYNDFLTGKAKNPYDKSIYGEGFLGENAPTEQNNNKIKEYSIWTDILRRCYSDKYKYTFIAYKNCTVSEEWKNYSNFYKWYKENLYKCTDELEVDKDILSIGKKIYSKETCLLIPREINRFCEASKMGGCYLTINNRWSARLHHKSEHIHIGNFKTFEEAEIEFLKRKNKIYQELVEKYREELPSGVYNKLKNAKLRG